MRGEAGGPTGEDFEETARGVGQVLIEEKRVKIW